MFLHVASFLVRVLAYIVLLTGIRLLLLKTRLLSKTRIFNNQNLIVVEDGRGRCRRPYVQVD